MTTIKPTITVEQVTPAYHPSTDGYMGERYTVVEKFDRLDNAVQYRNALNIGLSEDDELYYVVAITGRKWRLFREDYLSVSSYTGPVDNSIPF